LLVDRIPHMPDDGEALRAELRETLDALLAARLLWYRPHQPASEQRAGASAFRNAAWRARILRPVRLRRDVQLEVVYNDDTEFGSPVGRRPDESMRRLLEPLFSHARVHGVVSAIGCGSKLLQNVVSSLAFDAIAMRSGRGDWTIRPEHLYPDPSRTYPLGLRVRGGPARGEWRLAVDSADWPAISDLLSDLESPSGIHPHSVRAGSLVDALEHNGLLESAPNIEKIDRLRDCDLVFVGHELSSILIFCRRSSQTTTMSHFSRVTSARSMRFL